MIRDLFIQLQSRKWPKTGWWPRTGGFTLLRSDWRCPCYLKKDRNNFLLDSVYFSAFLFWRFFSKDIEKIDIEKITIAFFFFAIFFSLPFHMIRMVFFLWCFFLIRVIRIFSKIFFFFNFNDSIVMVAKLAFRKVYRHKIFQYKITYIELHKKV